MAVHAHSRIRYPSRSAMTQGVRSILPCIGSLLVTMGCTADPVSHGLLVASPHAEAALVRWDPDQIDPQLGPTPADTANAQAVQLALRGNYEDALAQLPPPNKIDRPISRLAVRSNRDVIAYWQQRRRFAGSLAIPDPHVGYGVRGDTTSLTAPGFDRRFGRVTQTLEVDAAGLRLRVPYDTVIEEGQRDAFRGDTELTLQAFAGKASRWPNTKLTAGAIALIHRSAACADPEDGRLDLFVGLAQRYGRLASTVVVGVPSKMGVCPGPCFVGGDIWIRSVWDLYVHDVVQPTIGVSAAGWLAEGRGAMLTVSPGLRFFLDARQSFRIDVLQHSTVGEVEDVRARRVGAELSLAYRWW